MRSPVAPALAPWMVGFSLAISGWLVGREFAARNPAVLLRLNESARVDPLPGRAELSERYERDAKGGPLTRGQWQEAISQCLGEPSATRRVQRFYELTQKVEAREFPALMEALRAEKTDFGLRGELFEIWAERDLKGARAWFDAQPAEDFFWLGTRLVAVWGRMNTAALANWISTLPGEKRKSLVATHDNTWRELIDEIAQRTPETALDLLATIPVVEHYTHGTAIAALLRRDPAAAAARTLAMPAGNAKSYAFRALVSGWLKTDSAAVRAWIEQLEDFTLADQGRMIVASERAGKSAEEYQAALEVLPPEHRHLAWESRASELMRKAPEEAIAFARSQADPDARAVMVQVAIREIRANDPERAAELWLTGLAEDPRLQAIGSTVVSALVEKTGVAAAERLLARIPLDQDAALKEVLSSIAKAAGWAAVADIAVRMPEGPRRGESVQQAVHGFLRDGESADAQQLVARLPQGADRDAALRVMGATLLPEDPEVGAATLLQLANGRDALGEELQRWLQADAPEARRWISATATLDAAEKAALLSAAVPEP